MKRFWCYRAKRLEKVQNQRHRELISNGRKTQWRWFDWKINKKCDDYLQCVDCFRFILTTMLTNLLAMYEHVFIWHLFKSRVRKMKRARNDHARTHKLISERCVLDSIYACMTNDHSRDQCLLIISESKQSEAENSLFSRRQLRRDAVRIGCKSANTNMAATIMDLLMFIYWNIFFNILTALFARVLCIISM